MREGEDLLWRALTDSNRRLLLDRLRDGPKTTGALCDGIAISRYGVMRHLQVLERCGLIVVERRGRERWNHLNAARLVAGVERWLTPFSDGSAGSPLDLSCRVDSPKDKSEP